MLKSTIQGNAVSADTKCEKCGSKHMICVEFGECYVQQHNHELNGPDYIEGPPPEGLFNAASEGEEPTMAYFIFCSDCGQIKPTSDYSFPLLPIDMAG